MSNEVVVTSADGWIGAHTSRVLHRLGWEVVGVSCTPRAAQEQHPRWRWIGTGVELDRAVERAGRVLDLGPPNPWGPSVATELVTAARLDRLELTARIVGALSYSGVQERALVTLGGCPTRGADGLPFLGGLDAAREEATVALGARVVTMRTGLVLGIDGGVFPLLRQPFDSGHGLVLGSGTQWLPWIHLTDIVGLLVEAIADAAYSGSMTIVAPRPAQYVELARAMGDVLGVPWQARMPEGQVLQQFGQDAEPLLHGLRLAPDEALARNYSFAHPDIGGAVEDLLAGPPARGHPPPDHSEPGFREVPCSTTTPHATVAARSAPDPVSSNPMTGRTWTM